MNKKFTKLIAAIALLVFMAPSMVGWGQTREEVVAYTLDGTITDGDNGYATESSITQNGISWKVTGNTTMNPWRIGGKSISNVDRPVYSTNSISDNITKIEVTHGAASSITVNSWTVIVATDASFNNVVSTLTPTFTANATTTINRPAGADWTGCYYKFIYNVTVTATSNKFIEFTGANFYKQEGSGSVIATPTFDPAGGTYTEEQLVEIECETENAVIYYTTDGTTPDNTSTEYDPDEGVTISETTTLKAIAYVGNDASSVASATYTIVTPLTTIPQIFAKATEVGSTQTDVYVTFGNWIVVGKSYSNAYVSDGQYGLNLYKSGGINFEVGDQLSGTVATKVQLYTGGAELVGLSKPFEGLTVTSNQTFEPYPISLADLVGQGIYFGSYVDLGNLTYTSGGTFTDGNNHEINPNNTFSIQNYPTLEAGKTYRVKGVFIRYNNTTERIAPVYASDFTEYAGPSIEATPSSLTVPSYVVGTAEPEYETLTINGSNLTANISLTLNANSDFEMSTDLDTWSSSLTLTQTNGSVTNAEVAIRLKAGLAKDNYTGTVTLSSTDAQNVEVSLSGTVTGQLFDIVLIQPTGGTIAADLATAEEGAIITLTATPAAAYNFGSWVVEDEDENPIAVNNNQFEMPAVNVLVTATFTLKDTYAVTCAVTPEGAALMEASPASAYEGQTVTLSYTAETGYSLSGIVITKTSDGSATGITPTASGDDYTFTMPGYAVTATATFISENYDGSFVKYTGELVEGDYLIVYDGGAMNTTLSSSRLGYTSVEPSNNIITNPSRVIVWHIAQEGDYWTIYNAKEAKYVSNSSYGSTNMALVPSISNNNGAVWQASGTETYEFRSKGNEVSYPNNARYLRKNGTSGFANYTTGYGGPLTLYKYTVLTERTITFNGNGGTYNNETSYTQTVYDGIAANLTANQFTKANANFIGWATTANGEVEYDDEDEIIATADITLYAQWETVHTLTLNSPNADVLVFVNESINPIEFVNNQVQVPEGATVYVSIDPMECYLFSNVSVTYGDNQTVPTTEEEPNVYYSFTMPTDDATVTVSTTAIPAHTLTVGSLSHVTLELTAGEESYEVQSGEELCEGIHVTVVATPDEGYVMGSVSVVYGNNQSVEVTTEGPNVYSFYMPTDDATINVTVEEYVAPLGGTITFGNAEGSTKIEGASSSGTGTVTYTDTGNDSNGNVWTITTVTSKNKSFTQNASYSQVGSSSNPVNSITFTTTFSEPVIITDFQTKFGGNSGTAGNITLKVGETTVGTGSLNGTNDVVVSNTLVASGTTLTVTVTDIEKGVKCYYISYEYVEPLHINGHNGGAGGWYLIASPVTELTPSSANGFITDNYGSNIPEGESGTYDLYYFDQTGSDNGKEWKNFRQHNFNLVSGKGYLYASEEGTDLIFTGTAYNGNGVVNLTYSESETIDENMRGWNLIGNPFGTTANLPSGLSYYTLNESRTELTPGSATTIGAMKAIFVQATATGQSVTFTKQTRNAGSNAILSLNLSNDSNGLIDRTIVRFDEGNALPKFMLNPNNTKVFIPVESKDYAVVRHEAQGEMPVNFKAAENGTYTLTVNPEGVEMNYLHLIDNMTGADIDLLQTPSYTFSAATRDYESRFRLVFAASNSANADSEADNFAFFSNGSWIINNVGEATLQVVDVNGRILSTETVNGSVGTTINAASGVYMLRLINGENVKVQKIVVR